MKLFLLLVVVFCAAAASAHHGEAGEEHEMAQSDALREMERDMKANMNEYFDNLLAQMRIFMLENGMVPMILPDSKNGFSVKILFVTWHGELELTEGNLRDLTSISRKGDADLSYVDEKMIIKAVIGFDMLQFQYNYLAYIMNIGPDGGINGQVRGLTLNMAIEVDMMANTQVLQDLEVLHVGDLDIWLTGTIIIDAITNAIVGVVTWLFEDSIVKLIVSVVKDAINAVLQNTPPPTTPAPLAEIAAKSGGIIMKILQH